jgi:hypothetical protein
MEITFKVYEMGTQLVLPVTFRSLVWCGRDLAIVSIVLGPSADNPRTGTDTNITTTNSFKARLALDSGAIYLLECVSLPCPAH